MKYFLRKYLGPLLRTTFAVCNVVPYGNKLLNYLVGKWAPFNGYSGARAIAARRGHARVLLKPRPEPTGGRYGRYDEVLGSRPVECGNLRATLEIDDRPEFGNPFGSVHAVVLALLGYEAAHWALSRGRRFRSLKAVYSHMAHGRIRAQCMVHEPIVVGQELHTLTRIYDESHGTTVARVEIVWQVTDETEPESAQEPDLLSLLVTGEESGGLALLSQLPMGGRAILSALEIEVDTARQIKGPVVSSSWCEPMELPAEGATTEDGRPLRLERLAHAYIRDGFGPGIAEVIGHWSVSRTGAVSVR